jgi:hypothetical protein
MAEGACADEGDYFVDADARSLDQKVASFAGFSFCGIFMSPACSRIQTTGQKSILIQFSVRWFPFFIIYVRSSWLGVVYKLWSVLLYASMVAQESPSYASRFVFSIENTFCRCNSYK